MRALSFGSVLTVAAFVSLVGNEFTRGTFRAALLHQPNRLALAGGKLLARMSVVAILLFAALVTGIVTSALVAPTQDVSTSDWFGLAGLQATGEDFARLLGWGLGWALIATTIAVLARSTPVALGIVILWFGPIENVILEDLDFARRWSPGQLLQSFLNPAAPDAIATSTASWTLGIYGAILIAVLTTVLMKRNVTS